MKTSIYDLHNDVVTCLPGQKFNKYLLNAWKHGVKAIVLSVWTTEMKEPMETIKHFRRIIDEVNVPLELLLHVEDAWFVDENNVDELIKCKPFSVGLTWNNDNALGGGAESDCKLMPLGKKIVKKLVECDVKIDLAHLNKQSFFEVAKLLSEYKQRLICTHTCFAEVHEHVRNLDSEQIQTIVNSDGIIGLTFVGNFLSKKKKANVKDVIGHIKYFLENFGENNLAIGTDFYGTKNLPKGLYGYGQFRKLEKLLIKSGVAKKTIDKIFFKNAERFLHSYI